MTPGGVLDYQLHDVISTLLTKNEKITQFAKFSLSTEQTKLLAASQNKIAQTPGEIVLVCEKRLNKFAIQAWPTNIIDEIKFLVLWSQRLAKIAILITSIKKLRKELFSLYMLKFFTLNK